MSVLIYDIMPPKKKPTKKAVKREDKFLQIVTLLLAVGVVFNWAGFSGIVGTIAYMNDTESSQGNAFVAGALDFVLGSPNDFLPSPLTLGGSASREIEFTNNFNFPKYKVRTDGFNGELCQWLMIEGAVDGGTSISLPLETFISNEINFSEPDLWSFKLTLPADAPETAEGKTCQFNFIFDGSQIKNDLPFGMGFNDTEEIASVVISEKCEDYEIKSHGYWKNHPEIYAQYLPQNLGSYVVDTTTKANAVFSECGGSDMADKLRCQLLAMKFNVAHFGVGEYYVESCGCVPGAKCGGCIKDVNKTINEIILEADDLLTYPYGTFAEKEAMKNLLDCLNNLGTVEICGMGGEGPMLVINKVYYDVDDEHGIEPDNEWVELYNPTRDDINISNWVIGDNTAQDVIPAGTIIPAHGYLLITGNSSTFGYWDIPAGVVKIVLADGEIGNDLDDDGDSVILKTSDGIEVDAMSYGTDNYAFDPSCADVDEGHMLGRYPNGFDTNSAADWKDYGLPSVTVIYPNGGETWYVGRSYHIKWTATNPSGGNSDILIDLYYSADSGATWGNIAMSTENDGDYYWRVPLYIGPMGTGYYTVSSNARIKAVAHNKNNFMVNDWDMTDEDFCPPIDYSLLTSEEAEYLMSLENLTGGSGGVVEEISNTVNEFVGEIFDTENTNDTEILTDTMDTNDTEILIDTTDTTDITDTNDTEILIDTEELISSDPTAIIDEFINDTEILIDTTDTIDTNDTVDTGILIDTNNTNNTEILIDTTNIIEPVE
jgi:predicted ribosomally synthesized peptide with SipW-like signal peptide